MSTLADVRNRHAQRLRDNRHLRYMWVPHTEAVVVVTCNEVAEVRAVMVALLLGLLSNLHCCSHSLPPPPPTFSRAHPPLPAQGKEPAIPAPKWSEDERLAPLRKLLASRSALPADEIAGLSATQCRDALLALGPLDGAWVKAVNAAEAEYWKRW